jgi:branched-chain amino acid aminotransferase
MFDLAKKMGVPLVEGSVTRNQLYDADEVFFTGTAAEVTPVREVDGYKIGKGSAGPISLQFADLYEKCTRGQLPEFEHWLTYV